MPAGITISSAMPPSAWTPITFSVSQQLVLPSRQAGQSPQFRYGLMTTGSPGAEAGRAVGVGDDAGELVADDAGILEEREVALEDVIVGAADADVLDGDAHPARPVCGRVDLDDLELCWARRRKWLS